MKFKFSIFLCFLCVLRAVSQISNPSDSLISLLKTKIADTSKVLVYDQIAFNLMNSKPFIAMDYAKKGLDLAEKVNFEKGKARNLNRIGSIYRHTGNFSKSLEMYFKAIGISNSINDFEGLCRTYNNMGILYGDQKEYKKALNFVFKANEKAQDIDNQLLIENTLSNISSFYAQSNKLDSAKFYAEKVYNYNLKINKSSVSNNSLLANLYFRMGNYKKALNFYQKSEQQYLKNNDNRNLSRQYLEVATLFQKINKSDSALFYAQKSFKLAVEINYFETINLAGKMLANYYENSNPSKSLAYYKLSISAKDSVFNLEKFKQIENIEFLEKVRVQELEESKKEFESQRKFAILLSLLGGLLLVTIVQYRNNKQKQKANMLLETQKSAIETQKVELNESFEKLKTTQKQLILQEKLASLGELTAGIAHEIQNPLNFVNNFSELSSELVVELKDEIAKIPIDAKEKELLEELLSDIDQNQQKIHHHGTRASNIVKGMLDHSRNSKGEKSLISINTVAEEYLKLAFLGARSKIKDFNADYQLIEDQNLPDISVNSQDISRVILNLINNAFYAVWERKLFENQFGDKNFAPKVVLVTRKVEAEGKTYVEMKISDNGTGISDEIKDKIFQPFFTTKPTGQGTGLGLSLSYEIITKGHNGTLDIESKSGEGATFIVRLPV